MAGPYLRIRGELGPAVKEALGGTARWLWRALVSGNAPVAGREVSPLVGIQGPVWAGPWVMFEAP